MALIAGHAVVIALAPSPPLLQDYPDWVYQGVLFARVLGRHPVPGYALKLFPVPNSLTTVGIALLSLAVGWVAAAKVWLLLVLAALSGGCLRLVRRLRVRSDAGLPVFGCSVLVGLDFWNGSINFQLSLAILLFLLTHLLGPRRSPGVTAGLLLLCFFTHMLPCAAGLLALAALALQERRAQRMLPALPVLVCLAWYALARNPAEGRQVPVWHLAPAALAVAGVLLWAYGEARQRKRFGVGKSWALLVWPPGWSSSTLLAVKLLLVLGWVGPMHVLTSGLGPDRVMWPPLVFWGLSAVGTGAAILGEICLLGCWTQLVRTDDPRRFLGVSALALAAMSLLFPPDALGVTGIDARWFHLALAMGTAMLGLAPTRRAAVLGGLAAVVCSVNLVQFAEVQFRPFTVSTPYRTHVVAGTSPVAPALRRGYYDALRERRFGEWIFPTAMFRQTGR